MELPDLARLPAISKFIERVTVTDIGSGAAPRDVTIQLPDADGAKIPARYTGFPPGLAVNDEVTIRATPQDTIRYMITGSSGASANKAGWPFDNILTVDPVNTAADHTTIAAAITAASAGDAIWLNPGTYTLTSNLAVNKKLYFFATPGSVKITLATSATSTVFNTADGTVFYGIEIENTATGSDAACVATNQDIDLIHCTLTKTGAATRGYGVWIFTNAITANLNDTIISVSGPTTGYGVRVESGSTVKIKNGSYNGNTDDISLNHASATAELVDPTLANDTLTLTAGSATGAYYQGSDGLWIPQKFVGARVYNSGNITLTSGILTLLTYDSERWDTDGIHSTSTNTGRLTAQTEGYYLIIGNARWAANATGQRFLDIKLNGTTFIGVQSLDTTGGGFPAVTVTSTIHFLSVGDYVELHAFQNSGGNLDVVAFGNYSLEFMMHRLAQ